MPINTQHAVEQFAQRFGRPPRWVARAPGRVNLIGEHTDYNDGFVLPVAIDRAIWIAFRPRDDCRVVAHSVDFDETGEFSLDELVDSSGAMQNQGSGWIEYLKAVAWSLRQAGHEVRGWEGIVEGDVPVGAGLSSSAALQIAAARAFAAASDIAWDPAAMARLGQRAENRWIGVNCGIMDQLVSAAGRAGHALLIDCRFLETRPVPFPPGVAVVILDTGTRRGLVDTGWLGSSAAAPRTPKVRGKYRAGHFRWERRWPTLDWKYLRRRVWTSWGASACCLWRSTRLALQ